MMLLDKIKYNLENLSNKNAFIIDEQFYTYNDFKNTIIAIQQLLLKNNFKQNNKVLIYIENNLETYASIFAVWFLGGVFIPINPKHPKERNDLVISQLQYFIALSSKKQENALATKNLQQPTKKLVFNNRTIDSLMYILFTSGSTGTPKGVPISYKNIHYFITDFNKNYTLNASDKFLQIYDLTFDASIHCYVLPLYLGASVYTVSPNKIKFLEAFKLLDKHQLTFAKFPPSVLAYLKPYFKKINLPKLKYSLLGGESLPIQLVDSWRKCVPNAIIQNVYGPTEATINTHIYTIPKNISPKNLYNGIVSIGKPFGSNQSFVIDKNNLVLSNNVKGELCLFGNQIATKYFKNSKKTKESFVVINHQEVYKTGDLVYLNDENNYVFCGRIDNQVQIQGYRVELSEIENAARKFDKARNFCAISIENKFNALEIFLFTEKLIVDTTFLYDFLKLQLPTYMLPKKIINLETFPLTSGGKIDKQALKKLSIE